MFTVETITTPGLAQHSYLITSGQEAFIIDPRRDIDIYLERLTSQGLTLKGVAETHSHADFVAGTRALSEATGAPLYSGSLSPEAGVPHVHLEDGQVLLVGDTEIVAIHTPGHTPDHFAYYVTDRHDPSQTPALFSGDVMFVGDLGRPELLGGAMAQELAPALYDTMWTKIRALPGHTILYPGHGAGSLCGKNLSSKPTSTLDDEFATSPALQLTKEAFVEYMLADQPRVPGHFSTMVQLNKTGQEAPKAFEALTPLDATSLQAALADPQTLVLDARAADAFSAGHIPETTYMGVNPGMPTWMGWLLSPGQRVIAIVDSPTQAADLQRWMVRVGFDRLDGYFVFDAGTWTGPLATTPTIDGSTFDPGQVTGQFIDVRTPAEFARGTLPGAQSIPLCELPSRLGELNQSQPVTLFCQGGYRGTIAASLLEQAGFSEVTNISGGYAAVQQTGCAVTG